MNKNLGDATAVNEIKAQIDKIENLDLLPPVGPEFKKWRRDTKVLLEQIFGAEADQVNEFMNIDPGFHVFDHFTRLVHDHDGVGLAGPIQAPKCAMLLPRP